MDSQGRTGRSYPIIPENENKCVWMKTGLVSYKLCDRDYRCETCPFDRAMRSGGSSSLPEPSDLEEDEPLFDDAASLLENGPILFHPAHCWVKVETHDRVRIGLDTIITMLMANVQLAVLPTEGSSAKEGESFAHILLEDYVFPVIAPLTGAVIETNYRLKNNPGLITGDPKGKGWLVTIRPDNLEGDLKKLFFGRKAITWKHREETDISNRVHSLMRIASPGLGATMQDGGAPVTGIREMLNSITPNQLVQVLDSLVARANLH